jgi:hypothetical protein
LTTRCLVFGLLTAVSAVSQPIAKVLTDSCASCHGGENPAAKLRLDSVAAAAAAVVPGDSAQSKLYQRIVTTDRALRMPPAGAPLAPAAVKAIKDWIESGAPGAQVDFAQHVEPVLKKSCFGCHSGGQARAQLRLDVPAGVKRALTPGKAADSRLVHRIEGTGGEQRMPLKGAPLSAAEIATIRSWIDQGAKLPPGAEAQKPVLDKHWSYVKPVRPATPTVKGSVANPIDAFILSKLESRGFGFSPAASKETLIRRVSLDLIGLPPSPQEVTAFVNDSSPDAYSKLVDRLLASPRYGERWARHWLDLARYADTNGYEKDDRRTMWKFRDWVIDAFNQDKPYDRFTVEQLAGDMLPDATESTRIATGFHRNTMMNEEGGVDKDEAYFEVLTDRVNTTATVWLGSTLACAQCHNHKYDPFTHKDYYQMMAFFANNSKEAQPHGTGLKYSEPQLDLATADQDARRRKIKDRIDDLEKALKTPTPALAREQSEWEQALIENGRQWKTLKSPLISAESGTVLKELQDGVIAATGENPLRETYTLEAAADTKKLTAVRIEALPDAGLPRGGPGRDVYGHFAITEVIAEAGSGTKWQPLKFKRIVADDGRVLAKGTKQLWTIDASREEKRLPRQLVLVPEEPVNLPGGAKIRIRIVQNSDYNGQTLGRFRVSLSSAADPAQIVKLRPKLRPVLDVPAAQRSTADAKEMADYFRTVARSLEPMRDEIRDLKNELDKLGIVTALVMNEKTSFERPSDHVRVRGAFSSLGEKVYADVPAVLGSMPASELPNRLGLARWIASKDNPLTARVAVNRIWEHYFGRGIVETTEDFGTQGERPVNPELLDWLAVEFMDQGWSFKKLHRTIVMSNAYRQTSRVTPELLQADPYNRLISRGPRFRLEAEMIRDASLAASGLLSAKVGGPSVMPPQPPGVWDIPYSDDKWEESQGEDRYRRGVYTFIRRSAVYPAMMNFDATSREFCTVRRIRTNSPLAALTTMNDTAFFEMAQAFAKRIVTEGGSTDSARVAYAFRTVTARQPKPNEQDRLLSWLAKEREYFASHPDDAGQAGSGAADLAPWTMLANVLLNLDETLTKE